MKRRAYDSSARKAAAAETRRRVLQAAGTQFAKRGFEQVTVAELATEAGVAVPTIFALFRSKAGVLKALMREALFGGRYETLVEKALASNDPRERIRMAASITRTVYDSEKAETSLIRGAAVLSRELKAIEREGERQRFERQEPTIALLFRKRQFARGLDVERARDIFWALTGRDLYRMLVLDRGWSSDDYEKWLADLLVRALVRA
jgi:AcrR family transcriptional regulator